MRLRKALGYALIVTGLLTSTLAATEQPAEAWHPLAWAACTDAEASEVSWYLADPDEAWSHGYEMVVDHDSRGLTPVGTAITHQGGADVRTEALPVGTYQRYVEVHWEPIGGGRHHDPRSITVEITVGEECTPSTTTTTSTTSTTSTTTTTSTSTTTTTSTTSTTTSTTTTTTSTTTTTTSTSTTTSTTTTMVTTTTSPTTTTTTTTSTTTTTTVPTTTTSTTSTTVPETTTTTSTSTTTTTLADECDEDDPTWNEEEQDCVLPFTGPDGTGEQTDLLPIFLLGLTLALAGVGLVTVSNAEEGNA